MNDSELQDDYIDDIADDGCREEDNNDVRDDQNQTGSPLTEKYWYLDDGMNEGELNKPLTEECDEFNSFGGNEYYPLAGHDENSEEDEADNDESDEEDDGDSDEEEDDETSQENATENKRNKKEANKEFKNETLSVSGNPISQDVLNIVNSIKQRFNRSFHDPYGDASVTVQFLSRYWRVMYYNPILMKRCKELNRMVREALKGVTAGWAYAIAVIKLKYLWNTIGAMLELVDGPIGAIGLGINVRDCLNFVLNLPIISQALKLLRRVALPVLEATRMWGGKNKDAIIMQLKKELTDLGFV